MKVIVVSNIKGGVGKTTTAHLTIEGLRKKGYKVLGIDLDQQCNLSSNYPEAEVGSYELLTSQIAIESLIHEDFISSSVKLMNCEGELQSKLGKEFILQKKLKNMKVEYDYVIIDTAPSSNIVNINAYGCADYVIIPCNADSYNLKGLGDVFEFVDGIKEYYNPKISVAGVLLCRYKDKGQFNTTMKEMLEEIVEKNSTKIFNSYIRENQDISIAVALGSNVFDYKPSSNGAKDYDMFIEELLSTIDNNYQTSILKQQTIEVYNYIDNMKLSDFVDELSKLYNNPKNVTASLLLEKLENYKPIQIKVAVLFATQYKNSFQAMNYYKKVLESHDGLNKDGLTLFKELYKIGE